MQFENSFPLPGSIDWGMILPIIAVLVTGLVAMIVEVVRPKSTNNAIVGVSLVGLVLAAVSVFPQFSLGEGTALAGMVIRDQFSLIIQLLLIATCGLTILFSEPYLRMKRIPYGEFYPLILWSTAGGMLMATSKNLLVIFIGLEMLSIALYVLAGMSRQESKSEESAMKYFLLGAFASGFFLYGIALFYGASGSLNLEVLAQTAQAGDTAKTLLLFSLGMMLVGLGFKSAFVPFHQWTPDVYQGAPTNVTAFMAVASKTAAIAALYRVLESSTSMFDQWAPALQVVAILTMVVGNAVALLQTDVKRILGYSSIAHAGYLLVGLIAHARMPIEIGSGSILYYLLAYGLMTIGAFAIISLVAKDGKEGTELRDLNGLWKRSPFAALMLVVFMVSLIGIPPFAGFFGKLGFFRDAMNAGLPHLAIVLAATSILSVAYYLQIIKAVFVNDEEETSITAPMNLGLRITCIVCAAGLLGAVFFYEPVNRFILGEQAQSEIVVKR